MILEGFLFVIACITTIIAFAKTPKLKESEEARFMEKEIREWLYGRPVLVARGPVLVAPPPTTIAPSAIVRAHLLILLDETMSDKLAEAVRVLSEMRGVKMAHATAGRYDVLAYVEVEDLNALRDLVEKVHEIPAIKRTETYISI